MSKMRMSYKLSIEDWTLLVSIVTLFIPYIPLGASEFVTDFFLLMLSLPFVVFLFFKGRIYRAVFYLFCILFIFHLISTIYGYSSLGVKCNKADIFVLTTDLKYLVLIVLASKCSFETFFKKLHKFITIGSVVIIVFCFVEYLNLFNLAWKLGNYYSSDLHTYYMINDGHRIVITGSDPNVGAVICSFFCLYNLNYYIMFKRKSNLVFTIVLYICIILTSSRTVFSGVSFCILIRILKDPNIKYKIKVGIISSMASLAILLLPYFSYLINGFQSFLSEEGNSSFNSRMLLWETLMELIEKSPFWGWGPAESIIEGYPIDGEYIYILFRFGSLGLIMYLLINIYLLKYIVRKKDLSIKEKMISDYVNSIFLLSLFVMITNNFYSGKQLFHLYITLLALLFQSVKKKNYENDISYPAEN